MGKGETNGKERTLCWSSTRKISLARLVEEKREGTRQTASTAVASPERLSGASFIVAFGPVKESVTWLEDLAQLQ